MEELKLKYPLIEIINEICGATQERQEAVANMDDDIELLIVVGDPKSNNSNKLVEVSEEIKGVKSYRIRKIDDIDFRWLSGIKKVAVTSGASTPTIITREVIQFLESFDEANVLTHNNQSTITLKKMVPDPERVDKKR